MHQQRMVSIQEGVRIRLQLEIIQRILQFAWMGVNIGASKIYVIIKI